jgi:hypothetical protein
MRPILTRVRGMKRRCFGAAMLPLVPGTCLVTVACVPVEKAPVPVGSTMAVYGLEMLVSCVRGCGMKLTLHRQW